MCLPLAEVEINCELGHIKTKAAVVTNDPGRYVLGKKSAQLFKDKPFFNLEKVNAVLTRSQVKRSREEDRSRETEMEKLELSFIETDEDILPQADEEGKEIKKVINVNSKELIESQHQSRDLASLLSEAKNENSSKTNAFKVKKNGLFGKMKIDKNGNERELIVIPEKYRNKIKSLCHDSTSGHLGVVKTKDRLTKYFYWPNCYKEIEEYVKTCDPCQRVGKSNDKAKAPLTLVPIIAEVFSKITFDACGTLPITPNGNRYLITAICLASKYPDAVPVPNIGPTSAAPEWKKHVPAAVFVLRTITYESTGFTPAELVYGRNLRTPVTLLYEQWMNPEDEGNNVVEYAFQLINRLKRCKELATDKMLEMQTKRKVWRAESVNIMVAEDQSETDDGEENFPTIDSEPTLFDFEKIKENSSLNDKLNEQQIQELHDLLLKFSKIFSNKPGKTHLITHDIQLTENTPIHCKPYRISP
ncbi:Retrovirus-related Pol polyprotein from transposon 412, partial [Stegodyphus mimosarum]